MTDPTFDLIVVGTGFASTFFLRQYLRTAKPKARVLVLDKGPRRNQDWVIQHPHHSRETEAKYTRNTNPKKSWRFSVMFGGGSNCWSGVTPRFLPDDFRLRSEYGVGVDWPIGYDDLETHYCEAEDLLQISGPSDDSPFARSRPYPQLAHRFSHVDRALQAAWPAQYFHLPCARPTQATPSGRPACCNNTVCGACPIDSKFTIRKDFDTLYQDPRITMNLEHTVKRVVFRGDVATGVEFEGPNGPAAATADFVALGANAIFNPFLLQASGLEHPALGRYLNEQRSGMVVFDLLGLNDFQGSTNQTGHGYMFYSGPHRRRESGFLLEHSNAPALRLEKGRYRQRMRIKFICEDIPSKHNGVRFNPQTPDKPELFFKGFTSYSKRALKRIPALAEKLVEKLPVERIQAPHGLTYTESHMQGTARMGNDPESSVVDADLLHHRYRNLAVLGGSSFPTSSPANPTLTISALSLRAGERVFGAAR